MREQRIFAAPVEVREESDGTATIGGYGAVFGNEYSVGSQFTESVDPRAFNKTLKERAADLAVVGFHNADVVLGTTASDTARFSVDERGLRYEADLDLEDPDGKSMWRKVKTGRVRQSSFSFEVVKDAWEEREDGPPHRVLREVRLWECSPVLWGANPATDVDVKRAAKSYAEYRGVEVDADSIEQVREASTQEPEPEPQPHSEPTPEPGRVFHPFV